MLSDSTGYLLDQETFTCLGNFKPIVKFFLVTNLVFIIRSDERKTLRGQKTFLT